MKHLVQLVLAIFALYFLAGSVWPRLLPDYPKLLGSEHDFFRNDSAIFDENKGESLEVQNDSINVDSEGKIEDIGNEKEPSKIENDDEKGKKIICPLCKGAGREILPCRSCNYDIDGNPQRGGGYFRNCRTCSPHLCSTCDGRGIISRKCRTCKGERRVNEFE